MKKSKDRISRRKFIHGGIAAAAAVAAGAIQSFAAQKTNTKIKQKKTAAPKEESPVSIGTLDLQLTVNGKPVRLQVPAGRTLAEVLRLDLGLTGVKIGCNSAECGACTVLVNSRPVYSCNYLAALADRAIVETVEGFASGDTLHPIQKAFIQKDALQCGFCTPGMICSTKALLLRNPRPEPDDIRTALAGNICRCGAYDKIVQAVRTLVRI